MTGGGTAAGPSPVGPRAGLNSAVVTKNIMAAVVAILLMGFTSHLPAEELSGASVALADPQAPNVPALVREAASFRRDQGDGAAPAGAGPADLHRQARDVEAVRAGDLVQVRQLLDLAVFTLNAGKVRRPDVPAVAGA